MSIFHRTTAHRRARVLRLVHRETGAPLRLNGTALTVITRDPDAAIRDLQERHDPRIWRVQVTPLGLPLD